MISAVVFCYDNPTLACSVLGLIALFDSFITARDLTGVPLLNLLIFIESFGFMLIFTLPIFFHLKVFTGDTEKMVGQIYVWICIGV